MTDEQKFFFDLKGWLLLPGVLEAGECPPPPATGQRGWPMLCTDMVRWGECATFRGMELSMETIELKLDKETLERARRLATSRGLSLEQLVGALLTEAAESAADGGQTEVEDSLWGMFRSDAEVLDQIVEEAMQARARDPFRLSDG